MRYESHVFRLTDRIPKAAKLAADDVVKDAQSRVRRRTGKFQRSIKAKVENTATGVRCEIGSPLASARIKERGGVIKARRGDFLVFNAGQGVRKVPSVRLTARPYLAPAGKQWPKFMTARLREANRDH